MAASPGRGKVIVMTLEELEREYTELRQQSEAVRSYL